MNLHVFVLLISTIFKDNIVLKHLIWFIYVIRIYLFPASKLYIRKLIKINLPTGFYVGSLTRFVIEFNSSTIFCKWPQINKSKWNTWFSITTKYVGDRLARGNINHNDSYGLYWIIVFFGITTTIIYTW